MFIFSRKKPMLLGIDISSAAVKLVELSKSGSRYRVESYAVAPLPQNAVVDRSISNVGAVAEALRTAINQSGTRLKHAAVAVSGAAVITKVIMMPASLSEDELEQQIQLEADQYIPYSLEEVSLDFQVLGPSEKNPEMVDILLAASRRENVEDRVAALEQAGLRTEVVDVESYAMESAFPLITSQLTGDLTRQAIGVADMGATTTSFSVVQGGRIVYTREQAFGGKQLTEEIQRRYGLSYEEAGLAKKQGGLPVNYGPEVLEPFKEALAQQVSRSLQFYMSATAQGGVDSIALTGGCASIQGMTQLVGESLGIATIVANPFISMSVSSRVKLQRLSSDAPAMMIACGLALRSFD